MRKEDDKLSLNMNDDINLPNLEDSLNIEDIPSIEDLISIDKEELEKIQEIQNSKNEENEIIVEDENDNEIAETSSATLHIDIAEEDNADNKTLNDTFTFSSGEIDLFNEDVALTLDEPQISLNDDTFNTDEETTIEEITDNFNNDIPTEPEMSEYNITDDNISFDNDSDIEPSTSFDEVVTDNSFDENTTSDDVAQNIEDVSDNNNIDSETDVQEIQEEVLSETLTGDFEEVNELELPEQTEPIEQTTETEEFLNEIAEQQETVEEPVEQEINNDNIYDGETKYYSKTDDIFAKIDSLLNDDSAFINDGTTIPAANNLINVDNETENISMPQPKYKSTFNPVKYMKKSFGHKKAKTANEEKIEILYTEKEAADNRKNISEELNSAEKQINLTSLLTSETGKKSIIAAAVCAAVIGVGIAGTSFFNNKSVEEIETLNNNDMTSPLDSQVEQAPDIVETPPPIIDENAAVTSNAPDIKQIKQPKIEVKQEIQKQEVVQQAKQTTNQDSYLSVKKIQWQIPDYLSYSPNIKSYLQTAGKSIKLGLSSDLLLTNEYAYSNVVKVNLKMGNSGAVQNSNIITSSGSKQIDNIVLQSVKNTLNVVKPPSGEIKTPEFNLTITIYL